MVSVRTAHKMVGREQRLPGTGKGRRGWLRAAFFGVLVLEVGVLLLAVRPAEAAVIERVVAIVGEDAILLSDVQLRARPYLTRVFQQLPAGAQRNAHISQLYKQLLEKMIDEKLQDDAATKARIVVTAAEVDSALGRIAAQNGLSVEVLIAEAVRAGMDEQEYRKEIRRQVLDAKLMNLRNARIRITEEDVRAEYQRIVMEERSRLPFRAAWIVLDIPRSLSQKEQQAAIRDAERISLEARGGKDFATLARLHSDDDATKDMGGSLGQLTPGRLPVPVDKVLLGLSVGETSAPIRNGDQLVVVKLLERGESALPSYQEAQEELYNRVYMYKMDRARQRWLEGLRRRTHVEVRL